MPQPHPESLNPEKNGHSPDADILPPHLLPQLTILTQPLLCLASRALCRAVRPLP